ncbi:MAG: membrane protein insertase YidC [Lentisphaeria bacterium]|nr:membrane protein insertase YidC [Lentisphaeria bacterium]
MKLDKESIIVLAICLIVLFGWEPFCRKMGWIPEKTEIKTVKKENAVKSEQKSVDTAVAKKDGIVEKAAKKVEKITKFPVLKLENKCCEVFFKEDLSSIDKIVFKDFLNNAKNGKIIVSNDYKLQKGMLSAEFVNVDVVSYDVVEYKKVADNKAVIKNRVILKDGSEIIMNRTYELNNDYTVNYTVSLKSNKDAVLPIFKVSGGDLQPWSILSGDKIRSDKLEITTFDNNNNDETLKCDVSDSKFFLSPALIARWEALSNKFFTLILKSEENFTPVAGRIKLDDKKNYLASIAAQYSNVKLDKNAEKVFNFQYYAGPKEPGLLKDFDPECSTLINLAWGPLNPLAKGLLWLLVMFKNICGSYGWSIIILTVIVRLIFWPVTQKSNESMKKMQKLQPQIKELREKYKDNPQLLNTKTMELYQKEQVNPFSGCLPILLQIPVFFALYATLDNALELRQVPFWWASDLATADTVWSHSLGFSIFGISTLKLNPLVIVMTALMVVQQKITPSAMDPAQQKMMALMPVIMLIFLYDLPSGLTLYWTVSQIFSLLQVYLQRRLDKKKSAAA